MTYNVFGGTLSLAQLHSTVVHVDLAVDSYMDGVDAQSSCDVDGESHEVKSQVDASVR